MGLKLDTPADKETVKSAVVLDLCLVSAKRYVRSGILFEGGVNYTFGLADAQVMLSETLGDDALVWRIAPKVKGQTKIVEIREIPTVSMVGRSLKAALLPEEVSTALPKVVEIGSEADNAEIAAMLAKDSVEL